MISPIAILWQAKHVQTYTKQPSRGMALIMLWNDYRGILHELEIAANMHATPCWKQSRQVEEPTFKKNRVWSEAFLSLD